MCVSPCLCPVFLCVSLRLCGCVAHCAFVSVSLCLSIYLYVHMFIFLFICLFTCESIIYPSSHPFVSLSIYVLSVRVFVCIPVHLSLYLLHTLHYTIIIITFFNVMCIIMYVIRRVVDRKNSEVFAFRELSKLIVGVFLRNVLLFL